jgi:hypothetical protein
VSDDRAVVTELLGRVPGGQFEVVVRTAEGEPVVIHNAPLLDDGTPMPTLYWLVGRSAREQVSRLEAAGGVNQAEQDLGLDVIAEAHQRYARQRDDVLGDHRGPRPSGGVGGTRVGVKCLHAHYAWYLAGGDDPVGAWVAARLGATTVERAQ